MARVANTIVKAGHWDGRHCCGEDENFATSGLDGLFINCPFWPWMQNFSHQETNVFLSHPFT